MMMAKNLFLLLLAGCFLPSHAQEALAPAVRQRVENTPPKENFYLYLMAGQSNMAGSAPVEARDTVPDARILRLNKDNRWEIAKEPLRFDKDIEGVSPGIAFARRMIREDTTITIGLLPAAVGGTSIDLWKPGAFDTKTNLYPYDRALAQAKIATQSGTLKGIIWHQGESDSSPEKSEDYAKKLKQVIQRFRTDLGNDTLPFVAGLLPAYQTRKIPEGVVKNNPSVEVVNQAIIELLTEIGYYDVALLEGAAHKGDWTHLNGSSVRRMGEEYAEIMIDLAP